jgi:hypothetical protein
MFSRKSLPAYTPERPQGLNRTKVAIAAIAIAGSCGGLVFAGGMALVNHDQRMFKAADVQRHKLLARSCGKHGSLWQSPTTNEFACLFVNRDGAAMLSPIPDAPYLDQVAAK